MEPKFKRYFHVFPLFSCNVMKIIIKTMNCKNLVENDDFDEIYEKIREI